MHFYFEIKVMLCFEIQKNSMNNVINISEDSLEVTLSKLNQELMKLVLFCHWRWIISQLLFIAFILFD